MFFHKTARFRLVSAVFLAFLFVVAIFPILFPVSVMARKVVHFSGKEMQAQSDPGKFMSASAEVITDSKKLPRYRGNGLVTAEKNSGGRLLRTPANQYFTLLNYSAGWRVKKITVVHEGGKPLDYVREIGYRTSPPGTFCWYSISSSNRVGDKEEAFYTVTFKQPGPIQLGLAIQIWPGYADDASRSFYISQVELVNVKTGDYHTAKLERNIPSLENNIPLSGAGDLSQDCQVISATTRTNLLQALARALKQRTTLLEVRYSGETLKMPDAVEAMLEEIFAGDDYLRYSLCGYNIRWSGGTNGDLVLNFQFQYLATGEEESFVERKAGDILRKILTPGINRNDHQKTKAIHDYIVANVAYDLNCQEHSAYAALVKGRTVCQGYALLLYKMLDKAGIKVRIVSGQAGGEKHAWNMVSLDGNWYHIDATWNDPVPDIPNRVRHDYYNRTDEQMSLTHTWNRTLYPAARIPYPENGF